MACLHCSFFNSLLKLKTHLQFNAPTAGYSSLAAKTARGRDWLAKQWRTQIGDELSSIIMIDHIDRIERKGQAVALFFAAGIACAGPATSDAAAITAAPLSASLPTRRGTSRTLFSAKAERSIHAQVKRKKSWSRTEVARDDGLAQLWVDVEVAPRGATQIT